MKKKRAKKGFREYISQKVQPIAIDAYPSHGSHSHPSKSKLKKSLDEKTYYKPGEWQNSHDNDHLGKDAETVHHKLNEHPDDFKKTPGAWAAKHYTENSRDINMRLIDKHHGREPNFSYEDDDDFKWSDEEKHHVMADRKRMHDEHVDSLDKLINHKPLEDDVHVYHGTISFNPGKLAAMHPERKIMLPSYMSTSIDREQAHRFAGGTSQFKRQNGGHVIHIHLKKGQKARYLGDNSEYEDEKEMLLPRKTTLKIHPKPDLVKTHPGHKPTWIWHAHVVDQED